MLIVVEDAPARGGAGGRESYRQNEGYVSFIKVKLSYIVKFFFSIETFVKKKKDRKSIKTD